jgi:TolC family type I secretion outer membrane protein
MMVSGVVRAARALLLSGFVAVGGMAALAADSAGVDTLREAMGRAYMGNPTLRADRARQRATDEQVPQALSGWRPKIDGSATMARVHTDIDPGPSSTFTQKQLSISLQQPIFNGFRTVKGTKMAEATVEAGRQGLLATEQSVLLQAVTAYMDVWRDRQIVTLRKRNVTVLQGQLKAASDRFSVGEVTRTDVSQARASLSASQANVSSARATLAASEANYLKVVGNNPGMLSYPKAAPTPGTLDKARAIANETNPNILAAAMTQEAAEHYVGVKAGELLPSIGLGASATLTPKPNSYPGADRLVQSQVGLSLDVPIYEQGMVYSQVRAAKQTASQRRIQVIEAGRAVREGVTSSWNYLTAAQQGIAAARSQVQASLLALDGVRQEYLVGSRTTLDVLNAEQSVLNARIALVQAEHDKIVASYQLLSAMGRLTAQHLALNVSHYDPTENYRRVRNKWIGTDAETVE